MRQCPLGLIPHFYMDWRCTSAYVKSFACQCPLGLIPHFYRSDCALPEQLGLYVSMPSRAYTSFLPETDRVRSKLWLCVNALSGLYLISTNQKLTAVLQLLHRVNALSGLYLISTAGKADRNGLLG